tara:strand:+ start:164 stop:436 length:273 start_codon:yes stop_codon:yes gene_type:complete
MSKDKTIKKRATFMEKIKVDWWHDDLWIELNNACNDPEDGNAVKDLNQLAMRWENLSEEKREHMNEAFIIICGWAFDTLLSRMEDGRDEG